MGWIHVKKTAALINSRHIVAIRKFDPIDGEEKWAIVFTYSDGSKDVVTYTEQAAADADFILLKSAAAPAAIMGG